MAQKTLLISAFLVLCVSTACGGRCVPGALCNVSADDPQVLKVALSAAEAFNNQSNDSFLFRPGSVRRAQKQVVKGVRFLVDVDLFRTVCRKRDKPKNLLDCALQPPGPLHQVIRCHIEVWDVPWTHRKVVQKFYCKSANQAQTG
uniref:Cystatin domain-containing protein n=1 Tax=Neogobius melanostomus TaxID=47308 RepID=A0A8C6SH19_9GOBI